MKILLATLILLFGFSAHASAQTYHYYHSTSVYVKVNLHNSVYVGYSTGGGGGGGATTGFPSPAYVPDYSVSGWGAEERNKVIVGTIERTAEINNNFCTSLRKRINDPETLASEIMRFETQLRSYECDTG